MTEFVNERGDLLDDALRHLAHPEPPRDMEGRIMARVAHLHEDREPTPSPAEASSAARTPALVLGLVGALLVTTAQALGVIGGQIALGLPTSPLARVPRWVTEGIAGTFGGLEPPAPSLALVLLATGVLLSLIGLGAGEIGVPPVSRADDAHVSP